MNKIILDENTGKLLLNIANVSFLAELSNNLFLKSEFFENMDYKNSMYKGIIREKSIGNPLMLQTLLYNLLVVQKDLLDEVEEVIFRDAVNAFVKNCYIEDKTESTYCNEGKKDNINFYRHIRNAVAHSECNCIDGLIIFTDKNINNKKEKCFIAIKILDVALLFEETMRVVQTIVENRIKNLK